jgi:hypothetical protein
VGKKRKSNGILLFFPFCTLVQNDNDRSFVRLIHRSECSNWAFAGIEFLNAINKAAPVWVDEYHARVF